MLSTLDRYIIGKYLSTFFFVVLICSLIAMAIDFSDKVQSFIEKPCTVYNILIDYYPGFVLDMMGRLMPLYTLIAVVFFTSRLAFNSEILAILNAGASFGRILRPYLIAASVIAVMHLALAHFIIPKANKSRLWFERSFVWIDKQQVKSGNIHFLVTPQVKAYIRGYDKNNMRISTLRLQKFSGNRVESILETDNAIWKEDLQKWRFTNYSVRTFDGLREHYQRFTVPLDTTLNMSPTDFIFYHNQNEEMTSPALLEAIARDKTRGFANTKQYTIEWYRRTADACTTIVLTVIGFAVAGRKVRGGMGLHLAIGIGIGAIFILLSKFSVSFSASGSIPIGVGMWIPNMIFTVVALFLSSRAQK